MSGKSPAKPLKHLIPGTKGQLARYFDRRNRVLLQVLSPRVVGMISAFDEPKRWIGHFEAHELEPL